MPSTRCSPSASRRTPSCRRSSSRHERGEQLPGGGGDVLGAADRLGPADADRERAPARAGARTPPRPGRAAGRAGSAASAPKRVSRAARGRAASWPTRRRPSRRRASSRSASSRRAAAGSSMQRLGLGRQEAAGAEPGPGPGGGEPAGHGQAAGQPQPFQAPVEIGHQRALAAEQMAAAGEVDGEPVGAVDHHPRAVAGAPQAQGRRAPSASATGSACAHQQLRADRPRVGQRQARLEPERPGRGADGRQPRHAALGRDQGQGHVLGRERPARAPRLEPHALERPFGQPERKIAPAHHPSPS